MGEWVREMDAWFDRLVGIENGREEMVFDIYLPSFFFFHLPLFSSALYLPQQPKTQQRQLSTQE